MRAESKSHKQGLKSLKGREVLLAAILIPLWVFGGFSVYRAEWVSIRALPELLRMDFHERAALVNGPVYAFCRKAASIIPEDGTIYFYNPPGAEAGFYYRKLNYCLYPRKVVVINPGEGLRAGEMAEGGYVMLLSTAETPLDPDLERTLSALAGMEEAYSYSDGSGRQAVYRVRKGAVDGE